MADGSVTIEVTLTKDQLEKGLKSLKSTINNALPSASKTLSTFASGFEKIGGLATSAGKKITVATAGIVAGLGSAISRFDTLNNYPKVLSNLGFNAEEAKESIEELSKGIDGLPTSLDDAASGVQRLVAKNSDIKKSTKYFLAMNDAIVAGNAPAEQQTSAIEQLTQAYSKGKPDLMEWRTLMMAMPGQLKQVATAMGYVDTDELYEALNKGKISMDTFMDAIVELDQNGGKGIVSFQEQAKNSCDSIGTAITNTANRIKKGFATILTSMNEAAKNTSFGSIAGMINSFSTSVKNFLDKLGGALKQNEAFNTFINQISTGLTEMNNVINGLSSEQLDKIVTTIINLAKAGPILLGVGKGFSTLSSVFNGLSGGVKILEGIPGKVSGLTGIISGLGGKLGGVSKVFTTFFNGINSGFSTMISGGVIGKFQTMLSGLGSGILNSFSTIGSSIGGLLSPITSGFTTMLGKVQLITGSGLAKVQNSFGGLIDKIAPNLSSGLSKITGAFGGLFGKIGSSMGSFLPIFTKAFNITAIIGLVVAGLGLLQGQFGEQINSFLSMVTQKGPEIITNLINGIVSKIPELIAKGGELLQNLLTAIIANLPAIIQGGIQIISSLVIGIAQQLPTLIPMALEAIITIVTSLLDNIDLLIDAAIQLIMRISRWTYTSFTYFDRKGPCYNSKIVRSFNKKCPKNCTSCMGIDSKISKWNYKLFA
jgi:tape measure domain-containing protein